MCLESIISLAATSTDPSLIASIAHWLPIILKVSLGLGFVIFVHELGHFLVAKACGVRCDKFFIGFDIGGYKLSRKWGETEYGIGILPLGGYVKMLGQDDDPSHVAEQLQKSQVAEESGNGVEVTGPNGEKYFVDRRSYLAKSVPQRMAIISAGVIMNVIFAFIFAVIAFGLGVPYMPSIVSETMPGSPAWTAGIQPGDEIVQIADRMNPTFNQLRGGVMLGDQENGIPTVIRRAENGEDEALNLIPERIEGKLAKIGVVPGRSLTLFEEQPTAKHSPAANASLIAPGAGTSQPVGEPTKSTGFQGGDRIVRVNDVEVNDYRQFASEVARHPTEPLRITVARTQPTPGAAASADKSAKAARQEELTFEVPTQPMRSLGMVMEMGPITGIQSNSPAEKAGLKVGDLIESIDGGALDGTTPWDPFTIPERMLQAAQAGNSVTLKVKRAHDTTESGNTESLEITVKPELPGTFHAILPPGVPMGVPALGIAYQISNRVMAVDPDGPAAAAKIQAGDELTSARFLLTEQQVDDAGEAPDKIELDGEHSNLPSLFLSLQHTPPGTQLELTFTRGDDTTTTTLTPVDSDLFVAERGFVFKPVERFRIATTFAQQLQLGWNETVDSLLMVYRFLQKIGTQVPITALGGPVTIAKAAGLSAAEGMSTLLIFLTMLSANLAVINFLPIPLLDGGHMVFLAYEGLRGRPANEKVVGYMHMAGFALIVSLMLFVLTLDLGFIPRNL